MKNVKIFVVGAMCVASMPAGATVSCPAGWITVEESAQYLVDDTVCPANYAQVGPATQNDGTPTTCQLDVNGTCLLYDPENYTDEHGSYSYTCGVAGCTGTATACAGGYWAPNGTDSVSGNSISAVIIQLCVPVGRGYASANGELTRTQCTGATYADTDTNAICTACPDGYHDDSVTVGKIYSYQCIKNVPANYYVARAGDATPTQCEEGNFKDPHVVTYGSVSSCVSAKCVAFSVQEDAIFMVDGTEVASCPTNYADAGTVDFCQNGTPGLDCVAYDWGTYTDAHGTYSYSYDLNGYTGTATACAGGYWDGNRVGTLTTQELSTLALSLCVPVGRGYASANGELTRTQCTGATYADDDFHAECTACPNGYRDDSVTVGKIYSYQCIKNVPANYYVANAGDATPTQCEGGSLHDAHVVTYGGTSSCYYDRCPVNWVSVAEDSLIVAEESCPTDYATIGDTNSCKVDPGIQSCLFYEYLRYVNAFGTYEYNVTTCNDSSCAGRALACNGGYWAPNDNPSAVTDEEKDFVVQGDRNLLFNSLCVNVGERYYSPINDLKRTECTGTLHTTGFGTGADSAMDCGLVLNMKKNQDETVKVHLHQNKQTTPSLNLRGPDGNVYYADMVTGDVLQPSTLRVRVGDVTYCVDSYDGFGCAQ